MEKQQNKLFVAIGGFLVSFVIFFLIGFFTTDTFRSEGMPQSPSATPATQSVQKNSIYSHKGEEGKDALTVLKAKTTVVQDDSGLVSSINGRAADVKKKEFWAFYVNGEMAQVGPAEYVTKKDDTIVWKIDTY